MSFKVNNKAYKGYARLVDINKEPILANAVSEQMFSKYGWNDGLIVELTSNNNIKNRFLTIKAKYNKNKNRNKNIIHRDDSF